MDENAPQIPAAAAIAADTNDATPPPPPNPNGAEASSFFEGDFGETADNTTPKQFDGNVPPPTPPPPLQNETQPPANAAAANAAAANAQQTEQEPATNQVPDGQNITPEDDIAAYFPQGKEQQGAPAQYLAQAKTMLDDLQNIMARLDPSHENPIDPAQAMREVIPKLFNAAFFHTMAHNRMDMEDVARYYARNVNERSVGGIHETMFATQYPNLAPSAPPSHEKTTFAGLMAQAEAAFAEQNKGARLSQHPKAKHQAMQWAAAQTAQYFPPANNKQQRRANNPPQQTTPTFTPPPAFHTTGGPAPAAAPTQGATIPISLDSMKPSEIDKAIRQIQGWGE